MEQLNLQKGEVLEDENFSSLNTDNSLDTERCTVSELKAQFQKINSKVALMLDVNNEKLFEKCGHNLCPCCNELTFPTYTSFVSHTKNLSRHPVGSSGRMSSSFNIKNVMGEDTNGDMIKIPSATWVFDSVEANAKARSILESSLLFHLNVLDGKMNKVNNKMVKSVGDVSGRKLVSCASTSSTCSHESNSSTNLSILKGLIYCVWKSGLPYFVLSSEDDHGEVYVASPLKIESSTDKVLDYIYVFQSRTYKRNSKRHTSSVVGRMKVSSSLALSSNESRIIETEFVLFGCHEDHSKEMQSLSIRSKGISKKVSSIFRSSHHTKHHSMRDIVRDELLGDLNEVNLVNHIDQDFPTHLELAAIVVKSQEPNRNEEASVGGWGLKFLNKDKGRDSGTSQDIRRKMNVLIPAGFHGGPIQEVGRPSTLTEKWRSGGSCDCGGWDLGCPIKVLESNLECSETLHKDESDDCNLFSLFVEGKENGEPTMRMVDKSEGNYHIYFKTTLSALQSFSIAVAVIHSRTSTLSPKL